MHTTPYIFDILFFVVQVSAVQTADEIQQLIQQNANNSTALANVGAAPWVNSPTVRGTSDLLLTCVVTLVACVYSVLHLNIPADNGKYANFFGKLRWVFVALLFPDTVLVVAVGQYLEARALRSGLRQLKNEKDPDMPDYDLEFCFFVVMGGFQVPLNDIQPGPTANQGRQLPDTLPLSPKGFLKMMEYRQLESSGLGLVNDPKALSMRNKGSVFQKALVVTQVLWMVLQCLVRKIQGLPISLLEVHVMVHVLCAVIIYVFWFKKPMDVVDAEVLKPTSDEVKGLIALAVQTQLCPGIKRGFLLLQEDKPQTETRSSLDPTTVTTPQPQNLETVCLESTVDVEKAPPPVITLGRGGALDCGVVYADDDSFPECIELSGSDVLRVERAMEYLQRHPDEDASRNKTLFPSSRSDYAHCLTRKGYNAAKVVINDVWIDRVVMITSPYLAVEDPSSRISNTAEKVQILASAALTFLYGGIHLMARGYKFPTEDERGLWEVVSIFTCVLSVTGWFMYHLLTYFRRVGLFETLGSNRSERLQTYSGPKYLFYVFDNLSDTLLFLIVPLVVANTLSRLFLTAESFLSVRSLPIGAFTMPSWLQMVPHL